MTDQIRDGVIRLAHAVARAGLVIAAGGNIAGRVGADQLWVTPTGWNLADLGTDDLVLVSADGDHLDGANRATSELLLHVAAMRARPDIAWSVHLHPPVATLLQALDVEIRAITTDHAFYLRSIATVPYLHPGSAQLADAAAGELTAGADVVLLRHHGCLVVADTPDLALSRAVNLEAAAEATYRAQLLGDRTTACPPQFLEHIRSEEAHGRLYGLRGATR
ncbi:MAG TPA: class II aldolase/adducin family protein [Jatrophihabitantaceae bacterium]|nr:class II aldolase/adducin family protein [Jatrophihabitantaceae bacterium]